jgi:hypothetical protein
MIMKFRLFPVIATICTATSCAASYAAAAAVASNPPPEIFTDTRTITIENGVVTEHVGGSVPDVFLAQASPENVKKQVRIITSGPGASLHNMPDIDALVSSAMSEAFAGAAHGPFAKTVKNAPYSAEVITEKNQALPDGNQISRRTTAMTFRDSAGRTRQETRDAKGDVKTIHINDSVDGTRFVLSPSSKSATRMAADNEFIKHVAEARFDKHIAEAKEKAKVVAKDGTTTIIEHPGPGQEIIIKRIELPAKDGKKEVREDVKINIVRADGSGPANAHAFSFGDGDIGRALGDSMRFGPIGMSLQDGKWSSKSATTPLGTKDIDGVRVDGKSVSYTIPAGEIGNRNPITVTTETWYSADLQATVYSKSSDPRVGETIYRLANVKRAEQPATLFTVPDGYSVKEVPGMAFSAKHK